MTTSLTVEPVEVEGIGNVTVESLANLTAKQLRAVLKHFAMLAPSNATKTILYTYAKQAMEFDAFQKQQAAEIAAGAHDVPNTPEGADTDTSLAQLSAEPEPERTPVRVEPRPQHVVPDVARWALIQQMAVYLSDSKLTPEILQGKPHDIGHLLLKANDIGVPLTAALDQLYVIKGRVGMESKMMRALARRDGHNIGTPVCDGYKATVWGRHRITGDEHVGEFTLDDALDMELITGFEQDENGRWRAHSPTKDGRKTKPQWEMQTKNMLIERATAALCRFLFSECLGGITYTPDELGAIEVEAWEVDRETAARNAEERMLTVKQTKDTIRQRALALDTDLQHRLIDEFTKRNFPVKVHDMAPAMLGTAMRLLEDVEAEQASRGGDEREKQDADAETGNVDEPSSTTDEDDTSAIPEAEVVPEHGGLTVENVEPICDGCHEPIGAFETPVIVENEDERETYHESCAPFTAGDAS